MKVAVDFCRGSGGAFLAINDLVVAGEMHADGSNRVIQSFEVDPADIARALILQKAPPDAGQNTPVCAASATRGLAPSAGKTIVGEGEDSEQ